MKRYTDKKILDFMEVRVLGWSGELDSSGKLSHELRCLGKTVGHIQRFYGKTLRRTVCDAIRESEK